MLEKLHCFLLSCMKIIHTHTHTYTFKIPLIYIETRLPIMNICEANIIITQYYDFEKKLCSTSTRSLSIKLEIDMDIYFFFFFVCLSIFLLNLYSN